METLRFHHIDFSLETLETWRNITTFIQSPQDNEDIINKNYLILGS